MARTRKPLIAGNWKMNGLRADALALAKSVADGVQQAGWRDREVLICPPATLILTVAVVRAKAEAAWRAGLLPIVCIGETLAEREAGKTLAVLEAQLKGSVPAGATAARLVVAYEPVWAIGTGKTPTTAEVAAAHAHIRKVLAGLTDEAAGVRLLYGGSVKDSNAAELLAAGDVDGALVGGASLKAGEFLAIAKAAQSG